MLPLPRDDASLAAFGHAGRERFERAEDALQIQSDHAIEFLLGDIEQEFAHIDRGRDHEYVEHADGFGGRGDAHAIAQIDMQGFRRATVRGDFLRRVLGLGDIDVAANDLRAEARQSEATLAADAAPAANDQGAAAAEIENRGIVVHGHSSGAKSVAHLTRLPAAPATPLSPPRASPRTRGRRRVRRNRRNAGR